ncbi:MAG: M23 family metallopeptidase [Ruminococcus sp.]|nr:M23 family metallopeptidase [Candidatus Copronaster equi]
MKNKSGKDTKKWLETKAYYAVLASLILVIVGVSVAIINVSKVKRAVDNSKDESTAFYSVTQATEAQTDSQANLNATGIADERETLTATETTEAEQSKFIFPLESNVIKDYSDGEMIYSKTMNDWRVHNGIDIGGEKGQKIVAVQKGNILDVYTDELWGDVIIIQHENSFEAKYCGVKSNLKKGAFVEQGQEIGTLSIIPLESKDGAHVHLEIEINSTLTDPLKAMNMLSAEANVYE